jgi:hypothetical protein
MDEPMLPPEQEIEEPAQLRFLRRLVTVLTTVMIGGVVLIIALLVIRLNEKPSMLHELVTLPEGVEAKAVTLGESWYGIVTQTDEILIFDRFTEKLRQRIQITPAQ